MPQVAALRPFVIEGVTYAKNDLITFADARVSDLLVGRKDVAGDAVSIAAATAAGGAVKAHVAVARNIATGDTPVMDRTSGAAVPVDPRTLLPLGGSGVSFAKTATSELSSQLAVAAIDAGGTAAAFLKDTQGMPLRGHIYRPDSASEVDVRACFAQAKQLSAGAAIVDVRGMKITLTLAGGGTIVPWDGLHVLGNWGDWSAPAVLDGPDIVVTGGTEFICGEVLTANKFNCFGYNDTDLASQPVYAGGIPGFLQTGLTQFKIEGVTLTGFKNGIKIGAKWRAGGHQCHFRNIHVRACSEWGFYLENFQNCTGRDFMLITNDKGQGYWGSANGTDASGSTLSMNYGNSRFENIFANMTAGANGLRRGLWICGRTIAGELNDTVFDKVQVNGGVSHNIDTGTMTVNSSSIQVANPALYEVGSHLCFNGTVGGLKQGVNYVVRSKTGNIITVAEGLTQSRTVGTAQLYPIFTANSGITTGATIEIHTLGYPSLQISGEDGNGVAFCHIRNFDLEAGGQSAIYIENSAVMLSCFGQVPSPGAPNRFDGGAAIMSSIVSRAGIGEIWGGQIALLLDFDGASNFTGSFKSHNGISTGYGSGYGVKPVGLHINGGLTSADRGNMDVNAGHIQMRRTGLPSVIATNNNAVLINETLQLVHRTKGGSSGWLAYESTAITTLTGGTTYTLYQLAQSTTGTPDAPSGETGKVHLLVNASASAITVNLDAAAVAAGQSIIGGGVSNTSRSLPANTAALIVMCAKNTSNGGGFYMWLSV